jgi:excisionase family DNA binding protein
MGMTKLLNAFDVAERLSLRAERVYELVRKNQFPLGVVVRIGKRQIRFNEAALNAWIEHGGGLATADGSEIGVGHPRSV